MSDMCDSIYSNPYSVIYTFSVGYTHDDRTVRDIPWVISLIRSGVLNNCVFSSMRVKHRACVQL